LLSVLPADGGSGSSEENKKKKSTGQGEFQRQRIM
jgi:hypothetical protein